MPQTDASIDLEWEPFKLKMDGFLRTIDRYTEYMKGIIAEANQDHSSKMKACESEKAKLESGISEQKKRETIMIDNLRMEREKMTELTSRLSTRTADIEKLETANQRIEAEHSSLEKQIAALKQRNHDLDKKLQENKMKDKPELQNLTELLGIKIVVGDHKLACRYTQIDAARPEKVYSVVIEWAEGQPFVVCDGDPRIPEMDALAQKIQARKGSEPEKMLQFLSEVRQMFMATVSTDPALNEMSNMFGSLTTRPSNSASAKVPATGAMDK